MNRLEAISYIPREIGLMAEGTIAGCCGIGATALSVITLGTSKSLNTQIGQTVRLNELWIRPYVRTIRILNPSAFTSEETATKAWNLSIASRLSENEPDFSEMNFLVSRIALATTQVIKVAAGLIDLVTGVALAALSLLCLGMSENLNVMAFHNLGQSPILELVKGILGTINPNFKVDEELYEEIISYKESEKLTFISN